MPELEQVRERDQNRCARCGSADSLHVHHRRRRSQGGGDDWANLVTLCASCHRWVHLAIATARSRGWLLGPDEDPADRSLPHWAWPDGRIWLGDDGGIILVRRDTPA